MRQEHGEPASRSFSVTVRFGRWPVSWRASSESFLVRLRLVSLLVVGAAELYLVWLAGYGAVWAVAAGRAMLIFPMAVLLLVLSVPTVILWCSGWLISAESVYTAALAATRGPATAYVLAVLGACGGVATVFINGLFGWVAAGIGIAMIPVGWLFTVAAGLLAQRARAAVWIVPAADDRPISLARADLARAAALPPYRYPLPLPSSVKAAHLDEMQSSRFRAMGWSALLLPCMIVMCVPLFWSSNSYDPATHTTNPDPALLLLGVGTLLIGLVTLPVVRENRALNRHKRLLWAYGVAVSDSGETAS